MAGGGILLETVLTSLRYLWEQFGLLDLIDILVVSFLIYYVIKFIRDRRASKLAIGIFLVLAILLVSEIVGMRALYFILSNLVEVGLIAVIILFQPELRSALEQVGGNPIKTFKANASSREHNRRENIAVICQAASELAREYTGALIVIERNTPLGDIIKTGTLVNGDICVPMLKNIFFNKAPMHDGAVVIRGGRIYAAGCFLPMSTNDDIIKDLGTRHRSAIGMSENSDAAIIVISEETGTISLALDGELRRNYDYNSLKYELTNLLIGDDGRGK